MSRFAHDDPKWLLLVLFVALPAQSQGADIDSSGPPPTSLSLGIGTAYLPDYEGSDDYKLLPLAHFGVENINGRETYARFSGRLDSNIIDHPHWRFGLSAYYLSDYRDEDDNRFEEVEDDRVSLLREAEEALQTGVTLGYDFSPSPRTQYLLEVTATRDVLHGNGSVITPRFRTVRFLSDRLIFSSAISASWASDRYMENRFGISDPDATRSGLDTHIAESGVKNFSVEASITWLLDRYWTASLLGRYQRITGDAADSPIVDSRGDAGNELFGVVVSRRFLL